MTNVELMCINCGESVEDLLAWRCPACDSPLDIKHLPPFDLNAVDTLDFSLWRYSAMLPVERRVSLGEGMTPLVATEIDGVSFSAKLEYLNPTGSYKDRGTVTLINHMLSHGVAEVVEDSSGNAGASCAAYCSVAGVRARIFVPATGSPSKKALIASFGGELVQVAGSQHAKTEACLEAAKTTPYASHAWSPFFVLGQMTVAWEVHEQMRHTVPDAVVCPVGHGGLFLGFARGFKALHDAGLIDGVPRMFAVQSGGCAPVVEAWASGALATPVVTPTPTVADGIIVEKPVRGTEVLAVIRDTDGAAYMVDNDAILSAQRKLAKRGLIVEPTSAVPVAALSQVRAVVGDDASIVVPLTGSGLKNLG